MPAPAAQDVINVISVPYSINGLPIQINGTSEMATRIANGIVNGWGAYPTTSSTFESELLSAFSGYLAAGSDGNAFIEGIGRGLDDEYNAWVASWSSTDNVHHYAPTASSVENSIYSHLTLVAGVVPKIVSDIGIIFSNHFVQEGG